MKTSIRKWKTYTVSDIQATFWEHVAAKKAVYVWNDLQLIFILLAV